MTVNLLRCIDCNAYWTSPRVKCSCGGNLEPATPSIPPPPAEPQPASDLPSNRQVFVIGAKACSHLLYGHPEASEFKPAELEMAMATLLRLALNGLEDEPAGD